MNNEKKMKHTIRTQVDDFGRKKFHLQEGEEEIVEDQPKVIETGNKKSLLIGRQEDLKIDKYLGRIEKNKKDRKKQVFYCEVCKEGFKCDLAYITHLNSAQHNSKLGMSMKVRAVSTQQVSAKLSSLKNNKNGVKKEQTQNFKNEEKQKTNKNVKQQEDQIKKQEQEQEKQKQDQHLQKDDEQDDLQAALKAYGLPSSFGSKKTKR